MFNSATGWVLETFNSRLSCKEDYIPLLLDPKGITWNNSNLCLFVFGIAAEIGSEAQLSRAWKAIRVLGTPCRSPTILVMQSCMDLLYKEKWFAKLGMACVGPKVTSSPTELRHWSFVICIDGGWWRPSKKTGKFHEVSGVGFRRFGALCIVITVCILLLCYCILYSVYILHLITLVTNSFPHGGTTEYRFSWGRARKPRWHLYPWGVLVPVNQQHLCILYTVYLYTPSHCPKEFLSRGTANRDSKISWMCRIWVGLKNCNSWQPATAR